MHMKTKLIEIVDDRRTDKHMIIGADNLLVFWLNSGKKGKIEFCLIFDNFSNNIRTSQVKVNFLYFYNQ